MDRYRCNICNKEHTAYYSIDIPPPDFLTKLIQSKDEKRLYRMDENIYILDKVDLYIKGYIEIETSFSESNIAHFTWMKIPVFQFTKSVEILKQGHAACMTGVIATENPFYSDFQGLKAELTVSPESIIGSIAIKSNSQARIDQSKPINTDRFIEMLQRLHHPDKKDVEKDHTDKKNIEKEAALPFRTRFTQALIDAKTEHSNVGRFFFIDISDSSEVIFQLVSSELMKDPTDGGIGLHISNDASNTNYVDIQSKMLSISTTLSIKMIVWDGIETYTKFYQYDDNSILEDVIYIAQQVYDANIEELDIDITEVNS